jgi:hypothetical protein
MNGRYIYSFPHQPPKASAWDGVIRTRTASQDSDLVVAIVRTVKVRIEMRCFFHVQHALMKTTYVHLFCPFDNYFIVTCCTLLVCRVRTVPSICCPAYSFYALTLICCPKLIHICILVLRMSRASIIPYDAVKFTKPSTRTARKSIVNASRCYSRRPCPIVSIS